MERSEIEPGESGHELRGVPADVGVMGADELAASSTAIVFGFVHA